MYEIVKSWVVFKLHDLNIEWYYIAHASYFLVQCQHVGCSNQKVWVGWGVNALWSAQKGCLTCWKENTPSDWVSFFHGHVWMKLFFEVNFNVKKFWKEVQCFDVYDCREALKRIDAKKETGSISVEEEEKERIEVTMIIVTLTNVVFWYTIIFGAATQIPSCL